MQKPKLHTLCLKSLKRTYDIFQANVGAPLVVNEDAQRVKLAHRMASEFEHVRDLPSPEQKQKVKGSAEAVEGAKGESRDGMDVEIKGPHAFPSAPGVVVTEETSAGPDASESTFKNVISSIEMQRTASQPPGGAPVTSYSLVEYAQQSAIVERAAGPGRTSNTLTKYTRRKKPTWHAPWKLKHVISGHTGWVRSVAVEPGNEWFCTGAADRTIKLWDLATGTLKLTLTGHIAAVRGVIVSHRHNYIFSCGEDRMIKCWDLEQNKVIRHYHGHLSGIYAIAMHPQLDVLMTGGRDSTCRVWDIRTKAEIHVLSGHTSLVSTVCTQGADPQVVTGSADATIKLWDLGMGKALTTLTNHKKSIRSMLIHPTEFSFVSAAADNVKKWKFPKGEFICNLSGHNAIINSVSLNQDNVLVTGSDNGSMVMWDWATGYPFQRLQTTVQPGSLDSEAGIFASTFDLSGARLITCEADKTVKVWWEDPEATPESHPVDPMWRPNRDRNRF
uniref:Uncharacterized protein n=1 Tax=Arcella intermedia TaxID=1963864 RepID=A0A6B2L2L4_9EUKA|eukprot:TRINITY_DN13040_c0_g1_i1.p1 TRINITY_DN13040_c0_g1~~TRINITY_DN13040_c0_g1_i1.p1  ORF type:complete len:501 (-),score=57.12 TRINITY_DN13040_c0_g1_i1:34-1536(-)